jgi:hypothetical protein
MRGVDLANKYSGVFRDLPTQAQREQAALDCCSDLGPCVDKFFRVVMALIKSGDLIIRAQYPPPEWTFSARIGKVNLIGKSSDMSEAFVALLEHFRVEKRK